MLKKAISNHVIDIRFLDYSKIFQHKFKKNKHEILVPKKHIDDDIKDGHIMNHTIGIYLILTTGFRHDKNCSNHEEFKNIRIFLNCLKTRILGIP